MPMSTKKIIEILGGLGAVAGAKSWLGKKGGGGDA